MHIHCVLLTNKLSKDIQVQVKEILIEESNVQPVNTPVTVCGDIHGQFHDLMKLFQTGGHVPATNYILWEISLIEVTTVVKFSPFFCFLKLVLLYFICVDIQPISHFCVEIMKADSLLRYAYGFLLLESIAAKDPLSVSVAILHQFNILPEMYQVGYTKLFFRTGQIGVLEDTRNRTLHGILRLQSCFRGHQARSRLREHKRRVTVLQSFVRGEKVRKEYTELLRRHRASAAIQSHVKRRIAKRQYKATVDASVVIQSAIRGELVRRCAGDIGWLKSGGTKRNESDEVLVKASVISELQRWVLKSKVALREKEEENDILRQRLQQYDNRWSEYETNMKSMEQIWQKQMRSLQSSLSIAKKSLEVEDSARNSDASVNANDATELSGSGGDFRTHGRTRSVGVGLSVISRLAEEFGQRAQVFGDDTKFLMEVKSGQVEANLEPERELRRLKQMFDTWKKDYGGRLRETKLILGKLGSGESGGSAERVKMKWWGRLKSTRF
ncbi:unnamed protein product [Brassica oleracea]